MTTKTQRTIKKTTRKKAKKSPAKKLGALDAAAKVLASTKQPMNARALIDTMASKKLWTSPAGKTPDRTLYAAIVREINTKGKDARFKRTADGLFAIR